MTAMHPDSGVPPQEARNSIPSAVEQSQNCDELWYSTSRCQPRFDPAAANAVLAELINLINAGEVNYNCSFLDQVQLAVRYLIQRGIPHTTYLYNGPTYYTASMSPTMTRYSELMTITVYPQVNNEGVVALDIDGLGSLPVLRTDRQQMVKNDWIAGVPYVLAYTHGAWYNMRVLDSQVPHQLNANIDAWIRTDGNDLTGDGTANTPDKAFRTIDGAWARLSAAYQISSGFTISMRLGIPGVYAAGTLGPYGGSLALYGDVNNKGAYRIAGRPGVGGASGYCLSINSVQSFMLTGVTCQLDQNGSFFAIDAVASGMSTNHVDIECMLSNTSAGAIFLGLGAVMFSFGDLRIIGNGASIATIFTILGAGQFNGSLINSPGHLTVSNLTLNYAGMQVDKLSLCGFAYMTVTPASVAGPQYLVSGNSIIDMRGQPVTAFGNTAGSSSTGGQFIP